MFELSQCYFVLTVHAFISPKIHFMGNVVTHGIFPPPFLEQTFPNFDLWAECLVL